jgi:hypothetical protein
LVQNTGLDTAAHFTPQFISEFKYKTMFFSRKRSNYAIFLLFIACLPDEQFQLPINRVEAVEMKANSSLKAVKGALEQSDKRIYTFEPEDKAVISGFVISSDEAGNFYKTLILQDKIENPDHGIAVKIDKRSYYSKYNFGRKIFIKLAGLSITQQNGYYELGYLNRGSVMDIPEPLLDQFLIRDRKSEMIVSRKIRIEEVSDQMINTYVEMDGLQFSKEALGKTFSGEGFDRYNGERVLEQCDQLSRFFLYTSTFADFGSVLLPEEKFHIKAVLSRDYYTDQIILILNDPAFLLPEATERCDPDYYTCQNLAESGSQIVYMEDFEDFKSTADIENHGWINRNINFGNGRFKKRTADENSFLQVSAYNTSENVMDIWLVSPEIDLDSSANEILTFKSRATFEEGRILSVWLCNEVSDDPIANCSWQLLDVIIDDGSRDGSNKEFMSSGPVDLGCIEGKIYLAFRYQGSDPGTTTTYDIDQIMITGNKP